MSHRLVIPKKISHNEHKIGESIKKQHLNHIDGLRGVAILMVIIFHLFVFKVSSGVDIFLFISGIFLLTTQIKNVSSNHPIHYTQSLVRIIRRLTPNLICVVSVGVILFMIVYPPSDWWDVFRDASASLLYIINWDLIRNGNSYEAIGNNPSSFQHLWSMSVQFQIFIAVITLVYFIGFIVKRNPYLLRNVSYITVSVLTIASFVYAIYMHNHNQMVNYYSTLTRFWEIGLGMLCGIPIERRTVLSQWLRIVVGCAGFILIGITGFIFDGANQFPGPYTLVPLLGAFFIIISGFTYDNEKRGFSTVGLTRILESKFILFIGKISYSLYLWHWILGLFFIKVLEGKNIYIINSIVIVLSFVFSYITYKYVDVFFRQKEKPEYSNVFSMYYFKETMFKSGELIKIGTIVVICAWILNIFSVPIFHGYNNVKSYRADQISAQYGGFFNAYPGARSIIDNDYPSNVGVEPNPHNDVFSMMSVNWYDGCYTGSGDDQVRIVKSDGSPCYYGDVSSQNTMYVVGGSHSEQYLTALDNIGKKRNIRIVPVIKLGCPLVNEGKWDGTDFSDCDRWIENAMNWIQENPPTMGIFITSTRPTTMKGQGPDRAPDSYVEAFRKISDLGIHIFAMRDNPWIMVKDRDTLNTVDIQLNARNCISGGGDPIECGNKRSDALSDVNPAIEAYKDIPGISHIDFSPLFCPQKECPAVIGNVLVYRDSNHLTDVFVQSLEPFLESAIFDNGWDAQKVSTIMKDVGEQDKIQVDADIPDWAKNVSPEDLGESVPYYEEGMTTPPTESSTVSTIPEDMPVDNANSNSEGYPSSTVEDQGSYLGDNIPLEDVPDV